MLRQFRHALFCLTALHGADASLAAAPAPAPEEIKVLLVNGRAATERRDEATYYLHTVLSLFEGKQPAEHPRVITRVVSAAQFANADFGDLTGYDCVFLCDVPRFARGEVRRLEALVRAGGGVVFCLGPQVEANSYNTQLYREGKGLLPVRLLDKRTPKEKHEFRLTFDETELKQPPLAVYAGENAREILSRPTFSTFVGLSESVPKAKVRTILSFEQVAVDRAEKGTAAGIALLEWRPFADGKERSGRVVLLTTPLTVEWNNWALSPSFVPAVHGLLQLAARNRAGK